MPKILSETISRLNILGHNLEISKYTEMFQGESTDGARPPGGSIECHHLILSLLTIATLQSFCHRSSWASVLARILPTLTKMIISKNMVNNGMVSGLTRKARQGKANKAPGCPYGRGGSCDGRRDEEANGRLILVALSLFMV